MKGRSFVVAFISVLAIIVSEATSIGRASGEDHQLDETGHVRKEGKATLVDLLGTTSRTEQCKTIEPDFDAPNRVPCHDGSYCKVYSEFTISVDGEVVIDGYYLSESNKKFPDADLLDQNKYECVMNRANECECKGSKVQKCLCRIVKKCRKPGKGSVTFNMGC